MRNAPAREGQGVECLHSSADVHAHITDRARIQFLARRGLPNHRAALLAPLLFGEVAA